MSSFTINKSCFSCGCFEFSDVLELGEQPLANNLSRSSQVQRYPLTLIRCNDCNLIQLKEIINPELLFFNYLYKSSISSSLLCSAKALVSNILKSEVKSDLVLEIGSNDGYLLTKYKELGSKAICIGVEPSISFIADYNDSDIILINDFFSFELSGEILNKYGEVDIIHANNVLAHIPTILNVYKGIKNLLSPQGLAIVEVQYFVYMMREFSFDMIYHEHLQYYTIRSVINLLSHAGLFLKDCEIIPMHGESLRLYITPVYSERSVRLNELLLQEDSFFSNDSLNYYSRRISLVYNQLRKELQNLSKNGTIFGYGASAKTTVLFNYCLFDQTIVHCIIDKNIGKQGNYLPGTEILIFGPDFLIESKPKYVFITIWNMAQEVYNEFKNVLPSTHFFYLKEGRINFIT